MSRKPLSQLDDWELLNEDQNLRGRTLLDPTGDPIGMIADMVVDTDTEQVDAIVLADGTEHLVRNIQFFGGQPVLVGGRPGPRPARSDGSSAAPRAAGAGFQEADEAGGVIPLREEELDVRKEEVEAGRLAVHKQVVAHRKTLEVPVLREEVILERRRVDPRPSDRPIDEAQSIGLRLHQEEVSVEKVPVVIEEVIVAKRAVPETGRVTETVRREELAVDTRGHLKVEGDAGRVRWDEPDRRPERAGE